MAAKVTEIPATRNLFTSAPVHSARKKRVAGYARVSTDLEEQQSSYEAQMDYYREYITRRSDWEFAGMYSDEGISATTTRHREGFNAMINDALDGKIDLIVTKSISRFARNTVDSLTTVRKLKEKGVEVYFEKENIWTLDSKGELLITIMSSLAQEESRSISENTTWGKRKAFADGKASVSFTHFLGYDPGFVINEAEAEIVRLIYKLYLSGYSLNKIKRELEQQGIKPPSGGERWWITTIRSILTNEKYKGDARLQKTYGVDFLQKVRKKNSGEVKQYYISEHHEAIIPPETWELVQQEIARRGANQKKRGSKNIYTPKIFCGDCGARYGRRLVHSNDIYRKVIFRCGHKYSDGFRCRTPNITEEMIHEKFIEAIKILAGKKQEVMANLEELYTTVADMSELTEKKDKCVLERKMTEEKLKALTLKGAQELVPDYDQKYAELYRYFEEQIAAGSGIDIEIGNRKERIIKLRTFIDKLGDMDEAPAQFSETLWTGILQKLTVYAKDRFTFTFIGGYEVTVN